MTKATIKKKIFHAVDDVSDMHVLDAVLHILKQNAQSSESPAWHKEILDEREKNIRNRSGEKNWEQVVSLVSKKSPRRKAS